jgi:hypothetical protein
MLRWYLMLLSVHVYPVWCGPGLGPLEPRRVPRMVCRLCAVMRRGATASAATGGPSTPERRPVFRAWFHSWRPPHSAAGGAARRDAETSASARVSRAVRCVVFGLDSRLLRSLLHLHAAAVSVSRRGLLPLGRRKFTYVSCVREKKIGADGRTERRLDLLRWKILYVFY